jgi:hypothetical protein
MGEGARAVVTLILTGRAYCDTRGFPARGIETYGAHPPGLPCFSGQFDAYETTLKKYL